MRSPDLLLRALVVASYRAATVVKVPEGLLGAVKFFETSSVSASTLEAPVPRVEEHGGNHRYRHRVL